MAIDTMTRKTTPKAATETSRSGITCEVTTISPTVAAAMLDQSPGNRKTSPRFVSAYARDMKARKWALTTEPICFDKRGRLLNGHHRLKACIEADTPFTTLVSYGLEPTARDFMDQGKARTASDALAFSGYHNTNKLAAVANMLMTVKSGFTEQKARRSTFEIMAMVKKHPGLTQSVMACERAIGASKAQLAVIHYIGSVILDEKDKADAFIGVFREGSATYDGDAAHLCRERGLRQTAERAELKRHESIKALIHAWNLFRRREPMRVYKWPSSVTFDGLDIKKL